MARYNAFNSPGNNPDFVGDPNLAQDWNMHMSNVFDIAVASVTTYLARHGGGVCQFYNPVSHGRAEPDLPAPATDIPWNGFPKRHGAPGPGQPPHYAARRRPRL